MRTKTIKIKKKKQSLLQKREKKFSKISTYLSFWFIVCLFFFYIYKFVFCRRLFCYLHFRFFAKEIIFFASISQSNSLKMLNKYDIYFLPSHSDIYLLKLFTKHILPLFIDAEKIFITKSIQNCPLYKSINKNSTINCIAN